MESQHAEQIQCLIEVNRFSDAIKESLNALSYYPDSLYLYALLCQSYLLANKLIEAEKTARSIIKQWPEGSFGYYQMSLIANGLKKFDLELQMAERAVQIDPEDADYLARLAQAQLQSGMTKAAKKTADEMIKILPDSVESHTLCGNIASELDLFEDAKTHFEAALAIQPDSSEVLRQLAVTLSYLKEYHAAIELIFSSIKRDPNNKDYHDLLFVFIKLYLDKNTLKGKRKKVFKLLPEPIQAFYKQHKKKSHVLERFSPIVMYLFWIAVLICLTLAIDEVGL